MYEHELYHYGVKGMKWGVRKDRKTSGSKRHIGIKDSGKIGLIEGKTSRTAKKNFAIRSVLTVLTASASIYIATHPEKIAKGQRKFDQMMHKQKKWARWK